MISPLAAVPFPNHLRKDLPDARIPWYINDRLFQKMQASQGAYKKVQVLPSDPEWRFIWRYFHHDKPTYYGLKRIFCVHERHQQQAFESNLSSIEREADKFAANWHHEPRADQRQVVMSRWEQAVQAFSPFQTLEADGRRSSWEKTKVLPLWHGSSQKECDSVAESGFVYFGKTRLAGKQIGDPTSTDEGYFGSGIYFTTSARYAADIYSQGHLLLAWVSMRTPFPVVGNPEQSDMATLKGKGAYKHYNAHYIPVVPSDNSPACAVYYPCQKEQSPVCDELVVFHKSQTLTRFWVELEVEPLYSLAPSEVPLFVNELMAYLLNVLQHPQIDRDQKLRNRLNGELSLLLTLAEDDYLEEKHTALFEQLQQLIDQSGKLNRVLQRLLAGGNPPSSPSESSVAPSPLVSQAPLTGSQVSQTFPPAYLNKKLSLDEVKAIPIEEWIAAIDQAPREAALYVNLARTLPPEGKIKLLDGTEMTKQQIYLKILDLDPTDLLAYRSLAAALPEGGKIRLLNGTEMTQQQLFLKILEIDPSDSFTYFNLGSILPNGDKIQLLDGTEMTKQQLYLKAIDLDPTSSWPYSSLAATLSKGGKIQLLDGTEMTKQQLYLKAIDLDPTDSFAYHSLGAILPKDSKIQLLDGTEMTKQHLYLKTLDLDPTDSLAYRSLAVTLPKRDKIRLLNGTEMTQQQLFLKTLELDPADSKAYLNLGATLPKGAKVRLPNGTEMTQQQLFLKTLEINPSDSFAYRNLGAVLPPGGKIQLLNGILLTKEELLAKK